MQAVAAVLLALVDVEAREPREILVGKQAVETKREALTKELGHQTYRQIGLGLVTGTGSLAWPGRGRALARGLLAAMLERLGADRIAVPAAEVGMGAVLEIWRHIEA